MKVLAIDPGNTESAWLLFEGGRVLAKGMESNENVLARVVGSCEVGFADHLAIEMVESFGMAVGKEVFETVYWVGRFVERWSLRGPFTRVYRKQVKMHLCHSMRAKDGNIRQALVDRLGSPGTKKEKGPTYGVSSHLWSALAIAVTFDDLTAGGVLSFPTTN